MAGGVLTNKEQYSQWVGLIYVFNLIVGTGALTLPAAFSHAGWLLSLLVIIMLAAMSYLTATFVIESMAIANAILYWQKCQKTQHMEYELPYPSSINADDSITAPIPSIQGVVEENRNSDSDALSEDDHEQSPLLENDLRERTVLSSVNIYSIQEKIELGQMATMMFTKVGKNFFYICLSLYLFGDLTIYCTAVSKSLRDVACTYLPPSKNCSITLPNDEYCWSEVNLSRINVYRLFVAVFILFLGPFVFFNVQKTKYLQILTTLLRWIAFIAMTILASIHLGQGQAKPSMASISGIPSLFGICVYSFMCHHSLPALVTPIRNKQQIYRLFLADYSFILLFYSLLAFTGVFAFHHLHDLYTLNFHPNQCNPDDPDSVKTSPVIGYFLALFPVFTLSTNFPIIGITLRNNLQTLFLREGINYNKYIKHIFFPVITILLPATIALVTDDVEFLVGFTGSYAGTGIQYIIPSLLVYSARQNALKILGSGIKNIYASPFKHSGWIIFVLVWAASCIALVTVNHIINKV